MDNKQIAIDLISRLPEDTPPGEIAKRIEFIAAIQGAEEQAERGQGVPAEEVRPLIAKWLGG